MEKWLWAEHAEPATDASPAALIVTCHPALWRTRILRKKYLKSRAVKSGICKYERATRRHRIQPPSQAGVGFGTGIGRQVFFLFNADITRNKVTAKTDHQLKPLVLGIPGGLVSFGEPRLGAENHTAARSARRLAS